MLALVTNPLRYTLSAGIEQTEVFVRLVEHPSELPLAVYSVELPGVVSDEEVAAVVHDRSTGQPPMGFVLDKRQSVFEWGASAANLRFLLDVLADVGEEVVVVGLAWLARRVWERRSGYDDLEPLDREVALRRARFTISINFGPAVEDLVVVSEVEDRDHNSFEFDLRAGSGALYQATVTQAVPMPAVTRIARK